MDLNKWCEIILTGHCEEGLELLLLSNPCPELKKGVHTTKNILDALSMASVSFQGDDARWSIIWNTVSPHLKLDAKIHEVYFLRRLSGKLSVANEGVGALLLLKAIVNSKKFETECSEVMPTIREHIMMPYTERSDHSLWLYDIADAIMFSEKSTDPDQFESELADVLFKIVKQYPNIKESHWGLYLGQNISFYIGISESVDKVAHKKFGEILHYLKESGIPLEHPISRVIWPKVHKNKEKDCAFKTVTELRLWYLEIILSNYIVNKESGLSMVKSIMRGMSEDVIASEKNKGLPENKKAWEALVDRCKFIKDADRTGGLAMTILCAEVERLYLMITTPKMQQLQTASSTGRKRM